MPKKILPLLFVFLNIIIASPCFSQDSLYYPANYKTTLHITPAFVDSVVTNRIDSIKENVCVLRQNQESINFLNEGFNLLGVASFIIALVTVFGIERVRTNNVNKKTQYRLFVDMIRHLYRNKVCTLTMYGKWKRLIDSGKDCYPSEEHFLKLQMLPEDIHFERYYRDPKKYHLMHEMELLLRNYNTEIEVAKSHLCNPDIDRSTKERDFATLNFKAGYLTHKIIELMYALNKIEFPTLNISKLYRALIGKKPTVKYYCNEAVAIIKEEHRAKAKANRDSVRCPMVLKALEARIKSDREEDSYFKVIFEDCPDCFEYILRTDIEIEAGYNSKKKDKMKEKIHIIFR